MGCPILLGYAEKACAVSHTCAAALVADVEPPNDLLRRAMYAKDPYRDLLERRAGTALRIILKDLLPRSMSRSVMRLDVPWVDDIPDDFEPVATKEVLQRVRERAAAWRLEHSLKNGADGAAGLHEMLFIGWVCDVLDIADGLLHDMTQGSYVTAGTALAYAMEVAKTDASEWSSMFDKLEEVR